MGWLGLKFGITRLLTGQTQTFRREELLKHLHHFSLVALYPSLGNNPLLVFSIGEAGDGDSMVMWCW